VQLGVHPGVLQQQQQQQRQLTAVLLLQVIGNKWDTYLDLLQAEYEEGCVTLRVELLQPPCRPSWCAACSCRRCLVQPAAVIHACQAAKLVMY
jgi:hypothetical protein